MRFTVIPSTFYTGSLCCLLVFVTGIINSCQQAPETTTGEEHPNGAYEANWESLKNYDIPTWFQDAKFGIFIHWGPYAVPAHWSEWYPRLMYQDSVRWHQTDPKKTKQGGHAVFAHHKETYGHPSKFGYKDFIPMFKAEKFDANEWIDLFKKAGARYVVPVAEHHDGFAMYKSNITPWNAAEMGPKKDVMGELFAAAKAAGLKFGASSHFAFNWDYYNHADRFDTNNPEYVDLYGPIHERYAPVSEDFMELWWNRTKDIIDNYEPDVMWFDFYMDKPEFAPYHPKLAAYYYNKGLEWGKGVVLQNKNFNYPSFPEGVNVLDIERGKLSDIQKDTWQTDTSIGKNSWCYTEGWQSKSANSLIDDLIDIVSKNGTLLLNIGPKADGTIPAEQEAVLLEIGQWLNTNGTAIYSSRPWKIFGEGPTEVKKGHHSEGGNKGFTSEDFRFTTNNDKLYAIALDWPTKGQLMIKSLALDSAHFEGTIQNVSLLGSDAALEWEQTQEGLIVNLPSERPGDHAYVFEID